MYDVYVSLDYGVTYDKIMSCKMFDDIILLLGLLDKLYVRWYVTRDGKEIQDLVCEVYDDTLGIFGLKTDYKQTIGNYKEHKENV